MIESSNSNFFKNHEVTNNDQSTDLLNEMQIVHSIEARHAAQHGDLETLMRLLESGQATSDSVDSDDCSLLHWAAINNRLNIANLLIQLKCNVNAIGGILSSTPLHWASRHGHLQMVALLVKNGADWTLKDVEGFTPLHIAVQFGCTPVAIFLIAVGQSPDEPDDTDMTPAMWAAYKINNVYPLRMLALMGADLEKTDANYVNTALHWAVIQGNHTAVDTLLKLVNNLEPVNKNKETPLDIAKRKNNLLIIRSIEMALRERGIYPSTLKQRLNEDKRVACTVLFCIPFFTTFCLGLIFDSDMNYLTKFELIFLLFMLIIFLFSYFVKERHKSNLQSLFLGAAISSKIFLIIVWLLFLHPIVPVIMQLNVLILMVIVLALFYKLFYYDPGFVNVTYQERCRMIIDMTENENWSEKFCSICLILKPVGTKHCRACDRCVMQFDHHCPWVNNCVGLFNHKLFLFYLFFLNLSTIHLIIGCLYYWHYACGHISYINILYCRPLVTQLYIYSSFFLFWISLMCFIQGYDVITSNTNKLFHQKYRSLNFGGNKFNIRCPLISRRLRKICSLGCLDSNFGNETKLFAESYSSNNLTI